MIAGYTLDDIIKNIGTRTGIRARFGTILILFGRARKSIKLSLIIEKI